MTTGLLFFGFLCLLSFGLAALLRRRFEQTLPLAFFLVALVQFAFGLVGKLNWGGWALWLLAAAGLAYAVWRGVRQPALWTQAYITPGFAAFAVLFFALWLLNTGRVPGDWDEFSHWALAPKNMWLTGTFGNGASTTTFYHEYPPAAPLLQYFGLWLRGGFDEPTLYRVTMVFRVALLLPVLGGLTWKHWRALPWLTLAVAALPLVFFPGMYSTLYVDVTLGLLAVYLLYTGLTEAPGLALWLALALGAAVLTLTKPAGLALALIVLGIVAARGMLWQKAAGQKGRAICGLLIPLAAVLGVKLLWDAYVAGLHVDAAFAVPTNMPDGLLNLLRRQAPDYRYVTIDRFFTALVEGRLFGGTFPYTFLIALLLIAGLGAYWVRLADAQEQSGARRVTWLLLLANVINAASLLLLYLFVFLEREALALASITRYLGTYLLAAQGVLTLLILRAHIAADAKQKPGRATRAAWCCLAAVLLLTNVTRVTEATVLAPLRINKAQTEMQPYRQAAAAIWDDNAAPKVFVIAQRGDGREMWQMQYELSPAPANRALFSIGRVKWSDSETEQLFTVPLIAAEWEAILLRDGYTHVFLYRVDDVFMEDFGTLFAAPEEVPLEEASLYRVESEGGTIKLVALPME